MQHYILTVYDSALKTFTIEYYDLSYNKLWSREFENASIYQFDTMSDNDFFDYTESNIYLDLNNNLYVIDMETGETSVINYAAAVDCGTPINPNLSDRKSVV